MEDFPLWSKAWNCWQEKLPVESPLLPSTPPRNVCRHSKSKICRFLGTSFLPQPFSWVIRSCRLSKSLSQLSHRYTSTHLDMIHQKMPDCKKNLWTNFVREGSDVLSLVEVERSCRSLEGGIKVEMWASTTTRDCDWSNLEESAFFLGVIGIKDRGPWRGLVEVEGKAGGVLS